MLRIVKKSTICSLYSDIKNQFYVQVKLQQQIKHLEEQLKQALEENKRLFDHHNKRLTKPKPDKKGILRNNDGTFARKK